jgi:hypothetical protein
MGATEDFRLTAEAVLQNMIAFQKSAEEHLLRERSKGHSYEEASPHSSRTAASPG